MSDRLKRGAGLFFMFTGLLIWFYGFAYSSFWYANTGPGILEPSRVWLSQAFHVKILPGVIEEISGLTIALAGVILQMTSYGSKG